MTSSRSLKVGTLVKFKNPGSHSVMPGWLDEFGNVIPASSLGMIITKRYLKLSSFSGWEYDILIPSLGLVSPNWGIFAFKKLEDDM